jgi:hypothetical protein
VGSREESSLPQEVQVGTILMSEWPPLLGVPSEGLESEPYSGHWRMVKAVDGFALDRKIRAAGWNFFFIASEVKVMFLGSLGAKKIQHALHRILGKVSRHHFNGLEVTGIVAKRFLGLPYTVVSAHSRHVQQSCYLDRAEVRQSSRQDAASTASSNLPG